MIIVYGNIKLHFPFSHSLKDKRRILQSILNKLKNNYNLSLCEVEGQNTWQYAEIGFACIANKKYILEKMLNIIEEKLSANSEITLICLEKEYL